MKQALIVDITQVRFSIRGIDSRQAYLERSRKGANHAKSEVRVEISWKNSFPLFSDLCDLGVSLREIFRVSVAALPRYPCEKMGQENPTFAVAMVPSGGGEIRVGDQVSLVD